MSADTPEPDAGRGGDHALGRPVPEVVDWLVGAVVALAGAASLLGGLVLAAVADSALLAEGVESGRITVIVVERQLTAAQTLAVTHDVVRWTGVGLLAAGLGLLAFAAWFVRGRHRAHARADPAESTGTFWAHAVYGAVATSVLSVVPFSVVVGGGLAGYLEAFRDGNPAAAGAAAGLLAIFAPILVLAGVTVGLVAGLAALGETALGLATAAGMLFVALFVVAYGAGLSALGGYVGGRVAERER